MGIETTSETWDKTRTACFGSLVTPVLSNLFNPNSNPRSGRLARIYIEACAVPEINKPMTTARSAAGQPSKAKITACMASLCLSALFNAGVNLFLC